MSKPKYVIIQDGDKEIQKIAVTFDGTFTQYAIVLNSNVHFVISPERYNTIVNEARENGYDVFDFTTFD